MPLAAARPDRASSSPPAAKAEHKQWVKILARYRDPDPWRSLYELAITAVPFSRCGAMLLCLDLGYWLSLIFAVPAAGFLVRLFMIQHDCGHGSFFRRPAGQPLGRAGDRRADADPLRLLAPDPCHPSCRSGNLDRRGTGDVTTLTVARISRPVALAADRLSPGAQSADPAELGPIYIFLLKHRLPVELMDGGKEVWISAMSTNLAIAASWSPWAGSWVRELPAGPAADHAARVLGRCLAVLCPASVRGHLVGLGGVELPRRGDAGSTFFDLPAPLRWFTANIGVHHVHHLVSRIPSYRLGEVLRDHPELRRSVG